MEIQLTDLTKTQCTIADFLWEADSEEDVQTVFDTFGKRETESVMEMMIFACFEDITDVSTAQQLLSSMDKQ